MTTRSSWGVGIEGIVGPAAAADLAQLAESSGYGSFWVNVLGVGVDPVGCLRQAFASTKRIEIGAGLFPLDKYPAREIGPSLADSALSDSRVIIGIAGGQMRKGVLAATADGAAVLRAALPACRIATGGYGPKMLELGGELADAILANWLTPERLHWSIEQIERGARQKNRTTPPIYLYHRAANGPDAEARLRRELLDYRRYPVHEKHQESMGNPEWIGVVSRQPGDIKVQLEPYVPHSHVVLRPVPRNILDLDEWRSLISYFAPQSH